MNTYPKNILTINQQLQAYQAAGMVIPSMADAQLALQNIGYYRLRGYAFPFYDNATKQYQPGTNFSDILNLYYFDIELSHLLFKMILSIEVSLRAHLIDALLIYNDALVLYDPKYFSDKKLFWRNLGTLASQIERSSDSFISHNYNNHNGQIPIWAAVEVMSFGNLSKTIKNLQTGQNSATSLLLSHYQIKSSNGTTITPSFQMFTSWIQAVSILRNICAHNSRLYNRSINAHICIPSIDQPPNSIRRSGLYQIILAMKYLRPSDDEWEKFFDQLTTLIQKHSGIVDLLKINFPADWATHLSI